MATTVPSTIPSSVPSSIGKAVSSGAAKNNVVPFVRPKPSSTIPRGTPGKPASGPPLSSLQGPAGAAVLGELANSVPDSPGQPQSGNPPWSGANDPTQFYRLTIVAQRLVRRRPGPGQPFLTEPESTTRFVGQLRGPISNIQLSAPRTYVEDQRQFGVSINFDDPWVIENPTVYRQIRVTFGTRQINLSDIFTQILDIQITTPDGEPVPPSDNKPFQQPKSVPLRGTAAPTVEPIPDVFPGNPVEPLPGETEIVPFRRPERPDADPPQEPDRVPPPEPDPEVPEQPPEKEDDPLPDNPIPDDEPEVPRPEPEPDDDPDTAPTVPRPSELPDENPERREPLEPPIVPLPSDVPGKEQEEDEVPFRGDPFTSPDNPEVPQEIPQETPQTTPQTPLEPLPLPSTPTVPKPPLESIPTQPVTPFPGRDVFPELPETEVPNNPEIPNPNPTKPSESEVPFGDPNIQNQDGILPPDVPGKKNDDDLPPSVPSDIEEPPNDNSTEPPDREPPGGENCICEEELEPDEDVMVVKFQNVFVPQARCVFNDVTGIWEVVESTISVEYLESRGGDNRNFVFNLYEQIAEQQKCICELKNQQSDECRASIPDVWSVKAQKQRNQLQIQYRRSDGINPQSRWHVTIPHFDEAFRNSFIPPSYTKGQVMCVLELTDNSKIQVNALSREEGLGFMQSVALFVLPEFRVPFNQMVSYDIPNRGLLTVPVVPSYLKFFEAGTPEIAKWTERVNN